MNNRENILITVSDLVSDFMYYDRKEDRNLPIGAIQASIEAGEITVDEIVNEFKKHVTSGIKK